MPPVTILDPISIDLDNVIADVEAIEAVNPHRHGMRMLDGIVYLNPEQKLIVAYKDCHEGEFWVPGHMPGIPLLPGVLMCEAAAQLACYYSKVQKVVGDGLMGLGGIENARFRATVRPGDRLVLVGRGVKLHRRRTEFEVQGFVGSTMAFNVLVIGIPIPGEVKFEQFAGAGLNGVGG
ncbi:MAG: beta-hydroxyacyl-ACP dehydratase [Planctomycetes bacterium]|nr:beta-hydroxyacyl-ACP dehydratase [Planctomycetota bacterium]